MFVLFKYFLDDKGHSFYDLSSQHMLLIGGNTFLIVTKGVLCVRAKTDIC